MQMLHDAAGPSLTCAAQLGGDRQRLSAPPYASDGRAGLRVRNADVEFHYLLVVVR